MQRPPDTEKRRPAGNRAAQGDQADGEITVDDIASCPQSASTNGAVSPYAVAAPILWGKGWNGLLPLPPKSKAPVPTGYTGHDGLWPSWPDVQAWSDDPPADANLAIRLPDGVLALDIDHYHGKSGGDTLVECETTWGALPPTVRITSRSDGISGIRLFRVPPGRHWRNLSGIDVLAVYHRYLVAPGSVHPSGEIYRLYGLDGEVLPVDEFPRPDELPELPAEWVQHLSSVMSVDAKAEVHDMPRWLDDLAGFHDEPCRRLSWLCDQVTLARTGRHDAARDAVLRLLRKAEEGHPGGLVVLERVRSAFLAAVTADGTRSEAVAVAEFARFVEGAVQIIAAQPRTPSLGDPCIVPSDPPFDPNSVDSASHDERQSDPPAAKPAVAAISVEQAHKVFTRWLGEDFDTDSLDAMLATAAVERLDGDPLWLLLISGSGNAKTETVQALAGVGAIIVGAIASEGALLSASPKRERTKDSTGGLLRQVGPRGVLAIKDVTSILTMSREVRGQVLSALREVYDGHWVRNVGTDGARSLVWEGRIAVVGAVTTAWDQAHDVISQMGDRFVLLRMDSNQHRPAAAHNAIRNTGTEITMRQELSAAVAGVIAGLQTKDPIALTDAEEQVVIAAADIVTRARTGVIFDYRGDVVDSHAPEMPTRFAKELTQVVRGAAALGIDRERAMKLAVRCARDSMPPLRLLVLLDVTKYPGTTTQDVRKRIGKPRSTVDRQLQALQMLGLLTCREETRYTASGVGAGTVWHYSIADGIDVAALAYSSLVVPD